MKRHYLLFVLIAVIMALLDQGSKYWAKEDLKTIKGKTITVVEGYFDFRYVENPGAAWGMFRDKSASFRRPFFMGISFLSMIFIVIVFLKLQADQRWMAWALSMVMGGALGNFIDRAIQNYVVDFIHWHYLDVYSWPTFNIADMAITAGVVMLFIEMLFGKGIQTSTKADQSESKA